MKDTTKKPNKKPQQGTPNPKPQQSQPAQKDWYGVPSLIRDIKKRKALLDSIK